MFGQARRATGEIAFPSAAPALRGRAFAASLAAGLAALSLAACEDRSVQVGINAAAEDAGDRVDAAAAKAENAVASVAARAQGLADAAIDETQEAVEEVRPAAGRLADRAGDQFGKLADATGNAAVKAGRTVADAGRDVKRGAGRTADSESADNRAAPE